MKRIYFILTVLLLTGFGLSAQQTLLLEDFESGFPTNWSADGNPGNTDWQVGTDLGSQGFPIPSHTSYAASNDNSCSCDLNSDIFITSTIDLTGAHVTFDSYLPSPYQALNIPYSHGFILVRPNGGAWIQVAEVTKDDNWVSRTFDLSGYVNGMGEIGFKHSDQNSQTTGWAIDNVYVYAQYQYDIGVLNWISPVTGCLSDAEDIQVEVKNFGSEDVTSFDIYYTLNGTNSATETVTQTIPAGGTYIHTFASTVNLAVGVVHQFNATVTFVGDEDASNASFASDVTVKRYAEVPISFNEEFNNNESYYWEVVPNIGAQAAISSNEVEMAGIDYPGWNGDINNTTADQAWNQNTDFHSTLGLLCNGGMVPSNTANLELVLDLRQETQLSYVYSWFAVFVNGTQIADIDGNLNFNPTSQNSDPFVTRTFNLSAYANTDFVIELKSCCHHPADKVFVDNVIIRPRNESDAGIVQIVSPVSSCGVSDINDITVVVQNFGVEAISNIPVYYNVDGGSALLAGYVPTTIQPGDVSLPYTFTNKPTAGLETVGLHTLTVYTQLAGDIYYPGNDDLTVDINNLPVISSFPYEQDFEGTSYWTTAGDNSSWELGVATGPVITPISGNENAWVTNLAGSYNNDENSYILSPCFDFSTLSDPYIEFSIWYNTDANTDGAQLQISTDNGYSWQTVGTMAPPPNTDNWYNNVVDAFNPGGSEPGWTDNSNSWLTAHHSLSSYAGEPEVSFKIVFASDADNLSGNPPVPTDYDGIAIDNIVIRDPQAQIDIKGLDWIAPVTSTFLTSTETISISVENLGLDTIYSFTGTYSIEGGLAGTFISPETFNVTILPGQTANVSFSTTADFSAWGNYDCVALVNILNDENSNNNEIDASVTNLPVIVDYPYEQYFQSVDHYWTSGGSNSSWELGIPAGTTIPPDSLTDIAWVTDLDGTYNNNEFSWVESPIFDLSSLIQPAMSMRIAYDAEGNTADGANLQYSENGGPWITIGTIGTPPNLDNWYINNIDGLAGEPGWTDNSGGWVDSYHDLSALVGMSNVKLRVLFGSDGTQVYEGMAFDDFKVFENAPHDLAVTEWQSQSIACGLTSSEIITVKIENLGFFTETGFDINYTITYGGSTVNVTETVTGSVDPGEFMIYSFTTPADFSVAGVYNCSVSLSFADNDITNNEITKDLLSSPLVTSFPYTEDFEGGNGDWFALGTNVSFELGTPDAGNAVINTPGSGAQSWVTNLSGDYLPLEDSYVISPCFNFTGITDPAIQFQYITDCESYNSTFSFDGANLEYSTDGGTVWTRVGNFGDTVNWYNYPQVWSLNNEDGWSAQSGGWLTTGYKMSFLAGEPNVKFRFHFVSDDYNEPPGSHYDGFGFDNIAVFNDVDFFGDLGISNIAAISGCENSTNYSVEVTITNFDADSTYYAGETIDLQYVFDGNAPVAESFTLAADLLPGASITYTFSAPIGLGAAGTYNLTASTQILNDTDPSNDAFSITVESFATPVIVLNSVTNVTCFGGSDGAIDLATNSNFTYNWSNGEVTEDLSGLSIGTYGVTVTDNNGCTASDSYTITEPVEILLSLTGYDNLCYNDATGSVTLTVTNGVTPYTYLWSNGETTQDIANLIGGTYSVTVTDATGCEAFGSITINQAGPFTASVDVVTPIVCNGQSTGELVVNATGGATPYSYLWDNGDTDAQIGGLSAGTYYVTVNDANGCSADGTTPPAGNTVDWNYVNTGSDHSILVLGSAPITVNGVQINPNEYLIGVFFDSLGTAKCGGYAEWTGSTTVVVARGTEFGMYNGFMDGEAFNWKLYRLSDGTTIDATATYDPINPPMITEQGNYSTNGTSSVSAIAGTVTAPPSGSVLSATLDEPGVLGIVFSPSNYNGYSVSCNGGNDGEIVVTADGGVAPYSFVWSNGATGNNIDNLSAGLYEVTVTDGNGCVNSSSITLTEPATAISASLVSTNGSCNGNSDGSIDVTVSGGLTPYTYTWSNGASTEDLTNLTAGTYSVTISDINGCEVVLSAEITESMLLPLVEDFEAGTLPANWESTHNTPSAGWVFGTALGSSFFNIPSHTGYAASNDDANDDFTATLNLADADYLITPRLDLMGYTSVSLTFDAFYSEDLNGSVATVEVTTNGGLTWDVVYTLSTEADWQEDIVLDLSAYINVCDVQIGFHHNDGGNWANGFAIDNVNIEGITQPDYDLAVTGFIVPPEFACDLTATQAVTIEVTNLGALDASGFDLSFTVNGLTSSPESYVGTILSGQTVQYTFTATGDFSAVGIYNCEAQVYYTADLDNSNDILTGVTVTHYPTISSFPYLEDFEDMTMDDFGLSNGSEASVVVASDGSDNALVVTGGNASNGWFGGLAATANDAWNLSVDHQVTAYTLCSVDASSMSSLEMLIDLRQVFANGPSNNWFRVLIDNNQVGPDYNPQTVNDPFQTVVWDLDAYAGTTFDITLEFALRSDWDSTFVDNLILRAKQVDLAVTNITAPVAACHFTNNEAVTVDIENLGGLAVSNFDIDLIVNGGTVATETVAGPINPGDVLTYTFTATVDLTALGSYTIDADVNAPLDVDAINDVYSIALVSHPDLGVSSFTPASLCENTDYNISFVLENYGTGLIPAGTNVEVSYILNGVEVPEVFTLASDLLPGANVSFTFSATENNTSGTYSVSVATLVADDCDNTNNGVLADIEIYANPVADAGTDQVVCAGEDVTLSATGGTLYAWDNGVTQDVAFVPTSTMVYTVTVTDANNCMSTDDVLVTVNSLPVADAGADQEVCAGESVVLSAAGGMSYAWDNGVTQDVAFVPTSTMVYTVTVTDGNYCTDIDDVLVTVNNLPTAYAGSDTSICNGQSVTFTATGGVSYLWSTGANSAQITVSPSTNTMYTVTVYDANNCEAEASVNVFVTDGPVIDSYAIIDNICAGGANGSIMLTVNGGIPPYGFNWSNGETTQNISGLAGGVYDVTVTDVSGYGCANYGSYTISDPDPIDVTLIDTANFIGYSVSCNGASDGEIFAFVTNGTAPYSYLWATGETVDYLENLPAGQYSIVVTDANGCTGTDDITLVEPAELLATIDSFDVTCAGIDNGSLYANPTGGTPPYIYYWNTTETTQSIHNLPPGPYSVYVTDANGCYWLEATNIDEPNDLILSLTVASDFNGYGVSCNGASDGAANVNIIGGTAPYSIYWSNGATTSAIDNLVAGMYTVTIVDANTCERVDSIELTQPQLVVLNEQIDDVNCFGGSDGNVNITVMSGGVAPFTYNWSDGSSNEDLLAVAAGTYTLTITDFNNCEYVFTEVVGEPDLLVADASVTSDYYGSDISCAGAADGIVSVSVTGGIAPYTFMWDDAMMSTTETVSGLSAGTYNVTVQDANGCFAYATVTLVDPAVLAGTTSVTSSYGPFNTNISCYGASDGSAVVNATGGTGTLYYNWSDGLGNNADAQNMLAGTYYVTVTDDNGCNIVLDVTLVSPDELVATTSVTSDYNGTNVSCNGAADGTVEAVVNGGTGAYTYMWSNGVATAVNANVTAGTYDLTVTDENGCVAMSSVTVTEPDALSVAINITSDYNGQTISCNGASDGELVAVPTGGNGGYTYNWSDGTTTDVIAGLAAGTYDVTLTDQNGCTAINSITIVDPDAIGITGTTSDYNGYGVNCYGDSDGWADVSVVGGTAPYTYLWSTGETTTMISNLIAGTYDLTVTDVNSCVELFSIIITTPDPMVPTFVLSDYNGYAVSCLGSTDGSIDLSVANGTSPYSFMWSNGSVDEDLLNLGAGMYTVSITDANGCSYIDSVELTEPVLFEIDTITAVSDYDGYNVSCYGSLDGAVDLSLLTGIPPFTYAWSNGSTVEDPNDLPGGISTVTVTDDNGCTVIGSVELTEPMELQADAVVSSDYNGSDISCVGDADGMVDLTVNVGFPPYSYNWSNGATTEDLTGLVAGTYDVTITDSHGCTGNASVTLVDPLPLEYTAIVSNTDCNGNPTGSIDLTVTGGVAGSYLYFWNTGANTEDIDNLSAGPYYVLVLDANWCFVTSEVFFVTEPPLLETDAVITSDYDGYSVSCLGSTDGSVDLSVAGGTLPYTYIWSNGETNEDLSGVGAGTYDVTVTDYNGCVGYATVTLTEPMLFEVSADVTTDFNGYGVSCYGSSDAEIVVNIVEGFAPYSYIWDNGSTDASLTNVGVGTYNVTVTDNHGCVSSSMVEVTEPDTLSIMATIISDYNGNSVSCNGGNDGMVSTYVMGGVMPYTYLWTNGETTADLTAAIAGSQEVVVTDANGCVASYTVTLNEPDALTADAAVSSDYNGADISCNGEMDGEVDLSVSGGTLPYTYAWDNGETSEDLAGLGAGTYTVTVTDANGCTSVASVTLVEPEMMDINVVWFNSLCYGSNNGLATVYVTGGTPSYNYYWSNSETTQTVANLAPGMYYVFGLDQNLCATNTYPVEITEPDELIADAVVISNNNCFGDTDGEIDLTVVGGTTPYTITWNNGATTEDLNNLPAGLYNVNIVDAHGCSTSASAEITEPAQILLSLIETHLDCYNQGNGTIDMTVTNGVMPLTYSWSNGATTEDLANLSGGFYFVTVTDATGCSAISGKFINEPDELLPVVSVTDVTCYGAGNGTASVSVTGGTGPYTYLWSTGSTSTSLSGLYPGLYEVTVVDAHGCTERAENTITQPDDIVLTMTGVEANCNAGGGGTIDLTVTGGVLPYSFSWSNGATTEDVSGLASGTYYVTVTDGNGCNEYDSYYIGESVLIDASFDGTAVSCNGGNDGAIDMTVTGGVAPYVYMWSGYGLGQVATFDWTYDITGSNHTILIENNININVGGGSLAVGDYIGVFYDNNGTLECGGYTQWTGSTIALSAWGADAGVNNGFAAGELFTWKVFRISDGFEFDVDVTYDASFPNTDAFATNGISALTSLNAGMDEDLSGLVAGTYTVTITDAVGCTGIYSYTVTEPQALMTLVQTTDLACNGDFSGAVNLTVIGGTSPYTFLWSNGETTEDLSGVAAGSYSVDILDSHGCSTSASATIYEPDVLEFTWTSVDVACNGDNTGSASVTVTGGTSPYSIDWGGYDENALAAGTYTVIVTDYNACTVQHDIVINEPLALDATYAVTDVACYGDNSGSVDVTVSGGVSPYSYLWSNGETSEDLSGMIAGMFDLTITDYNGCVFTLTSITINQPDELVLSGNTTDVLCYGNATGAIDLTVAGGVQPYTFAWNNSEITEDISNLVAGSYDVVVTDANGCSANMSFVIAEPAELTMTYLVSDVTCNGGSDGAVDITVDGGVTPYTFSWSNGEVTEDISGIVAGDYTIEVTDANGCVISAVATVTEPLAIELSFATQNVSCYGFNDGAIDMTITNGVAPFTVDWASVGNTEDITALYAGDYTVIVTDYTGCVATAVVTVTEPDELLISSVTTDVSCYNANDASIDITVTGGTPAYGYEWLEFPGTLFDWNYINTGTNHTVIISENTPIDLNGTPISNGDVIGVFYDSLGTEVCAGYVVWTGINTNVAAWGTETDLVTGQSLNDGYAYGEELKFKIWQASTGIVYDATPDYVPGFLDSAYYVTDGMSSLASLTGYIPYNNAGVSEDLTNLGSGAYMVIVTDANGCETSEEFIIYQPEQIVVEGITSDFVGFGVSSCGGSDGTIDISVSGGQAPYLFTWSNGESTEDLANLAAGSYDVVITDASGCNGYASFEITEFCDPIILNCVATDVTCYGGENGSIYVNISGGLAPFTFLWSNGYVTEDLSDIPVGTYEVTVTDAYGQVATCSSVVSSPDAITYNTDVTNIGCSGAAAGSVDVTMAGGTPPFSFAWTNGAATEDIDNLTAGVYGCFIVDANGCQTAFSVVVSENDPIAVASVITDVTVFGGNTGAIDVTVTGGVPAYSYSWSNGETTEDISGLVAGSYTLTITDDTGCEYVETFDVLEPTNPLEITSIVATDVTCMGMTNGSVDLTVSYGLSPYTYSWSNGAITEDLVDVAAGMYDVTVTDNVGTTVTGSIVVNEPSSGISATTVVTDAWSCLQNGLVDLTVSGGTTPYTFLWSDGSVDEDLVDVGTGTYSVVITDAGGCEITVDNLTVNADMIDASIMSTGNTCYGDADGTALVLVTGGALPYSYEWSNGETVDYIFGLTAGNYEVTVTDYFGCTYVQSVDIIDPDEIVVEIVNNPIGLTANVVSGAVGSVTYLWSNGKPYQSIKGLTSGAQYCVTVTDSNGCTGTACVIYTGSPIISYGGSSFSSNGKDMEADNNAIISALDINIYPNPNKDGKFYIDFGNAELESLQYEIVDAYGQVIYNQKLSDSVNTRILVQLGNVSAGVYYLRVITDNNGVITKKIVIVD